jgi:hypothetical protein
MTIEEYRNKLDMYKNVISPKKDIHLKLHIDSNSKQNNELKRQSSSMPQIAQYTLRNNP